MTTKSPQQTNIGTEEYTFPHVAMNGDASDEIRPKARVSPHPTPLYLSGMTSGV